MPSKPLTMCRTPGCRSLCKGGLCDACKAKSGTSGKTNWRDDKVRGTRTQRGYGYDWLRLRKRKLKANPFCEECERKAEAEGLVSTVLAEEVHHKVPFKGINDPLRLDWDNLESLCRACHGRRTARRKAHPGGGL